jgi:hypothetical protein
MPSPRFLLVALIVLSSVLSVLSVGVSRSQHGDHEWRAARVQASEGSGEAASLESTPVIVLATVASFALAMVAWFRPDDRHLLTIALALLAFAILDAAQLVHQLRESEVRLAAVAGLIGIVHLSASTVALSIRGLPPEPAREMALAPSRR